MERSNAIKMEKRRKKKTNIGVPNNCTFIDTNRGSILSKTVCGIEGLLRQDSSLLYVHSYQGATLRALVNKCCHE